MEDNFKNFKRKVNPQFYYRGNDIVKLWEQYLKTNGDNQGQAIKFFSDEETISHSIFNGLDQQKEIAIVLNNDTTLYKNKDGKTITLCGEVNFQNEDIQQKIQACLNQLKTYNTTYRENKITENYYNKILSNLEIFDDLSKKESIFNPEITNLALLMK